MTRFNQRRGASSNHTCSNARHGETHLFSRLRVGGARAASASICSPVRLFDYRETAVVLIVIILLVVITDYLGARLRARII